MHHKELSSAQLYKACDVSGLSFETTSELEPIRRVSNWAGLSHNSVLLRWWRHVVVQWFGHVPEE